MEVLRPQTPREKFSHPEITAKGETRAWVDPTTLKTLWFNTGTLCNLQCENCYIESSPQNDRLVYITTADVKSYLDEIQNNALGTTEIGFTGGEPFLNPEMIQILELCLNRGFQILMLTNGMRPMMNHSEELLRLQKEWGSQLKMRVSLDHYSQEGHMAERGPRSWKPAMRGLKWLSDHRFQLSVAGRTLWGEEEKEMRKGYGDLFQNEGIKLDPYSQEDLILFPEMEEKKDIPEITTACWEILKRSPDEMMCATSRMVIKRKGFKRASVVACTLLPYEPEFEMGNTLKEALKPIRLNHPHCAQFCVLGGGSCSGD